MKIRTLSLIAALSLGGLLAGTNLASAQDSNTNRGQRRGPSVEQQMERLNTELKLTDAQKPKVEALLKERQKKMRDLRSDQSLSDEQRREKFRSLREEETKQLKAILTPEQFEKYQAMPRPGRRGGAQGGQSNGKSKQGQ